MLINSLSLENFKCFEKLDVKFAPITLLTGANSSGKSSLINAILAILQTEHFPFYLSPNGRYVNMGSFDEMLYWGVSENANIKIDIEFNIENHRSQEKYSTVWGINDKNGLPVLIGLNFQDKNDSWNISRDSSGLYFMAGNTYIYNASDIEKVKEYFPNALIEKSDKTYFKVRIENAMFTSFDELMKISHQASIYLPDFAELYYDFGLNYNYLGSFRLPPERTYYQKPRASDKVAVSGDGYIDQIIEWEETDTEKFLRLEKVVQDLQLVNGIKTTKLKGGRFELNLKIASNSNFASLTDVGFGVSQFLPVVVADLQLSDDSILAVSQPEIHLHPRIQAKFGNYLSNQIKETNKQYIIETHSEYLLNRIRLLLVTGELKPEDVKVYYFENDGVKSVVHDVEFTTSGAVKGAPDGFFETYEMDVMDIAMHAVK